MIDTCLCLWSRYDISLIKLFTIFQIFNMLELAIWQFLHAQVFLWARRWIVPPCSASRTTPRGCSMSAPVSLSSLTCFLNCCRDVSTLWFEDDKNLPVLQICADDVNIVDQAKNSTQSHFCQHLKITQERIFLFDRFAPLYLWRASVDVTANNNSWRLHLVKNDL